MLIPRIDTAPWCPALSIPCACSIALPHPSLPPPMMLAASPSQAPSRKTSWSPPMTTMSAAACLMMLAATCGGIAYLPPSAMLWQRAKTHPVGSSPSNPSPGAVACCPPPPLLGGQAAGLVPAYGGASRGPRPLGSPAVVCALGRGPAAVACRSGGHPAPAVGPPRAGPGPGPAAAAAARPGEGASGVRPG